MNFKRIAQALTPAALGAASFGASAQVVTVGYAQDQVAAVPISPWLTLAIATMLALTAWAFLRRKGGTGLLLLALAVGAGGLASAPQDVKAVAVLPSCTSLTQLAGTRVGCLSLTLPSPTVSADFGFISTASFGFIDVVNNTGGGITLSTVGAANGASGGAWSIVSTPGSFPANFTLYAPTCTVGLHLAAGARCSIYLAGGSPG